ncbi:hypothetical protein D3273_27055 [Lichenibacterium minor]|uniref:Uncharacterized protein n=1 Tax=Lichenibacterium minor TaxID=2316528 RepID=A0A4V1RTU3_9HYPH|nr:hypothetical protein [Lichenibacterium minor]RYC28854.1 hypothetical protein D3273_27055 [Lichenibacterium minor]
MTDNRPTITDPGLLDLAAQGVDLSRMGSAYAARAYPKLDTVSPRDAYSLGFTDGVKAMAAQLPGLLSGALDVREVIARLYDPDLLPLAGGGA